MKDKRIWILAGAVAVTFLAVVLVLVQIWTEKPQTVGICYASAIHEEAQALTQQLQQSGFHVTVVCGNGTEDGQLSQIENLVESGCDALIVENPDTESTVLSAYLEQCRLPVVILGEGVENLTCLSVPYTQIGQQQADIVAALPNGGDVNGDGTVCYLVLQENTQGHTEQTAAFSRSLDSQTYCISTGYTDGTRSNAQQLCSQELAAYGMDIEVIVCSSDAITSGASLAIRDGGWQVGSDLYLIGTGSQNLSLIQEGVLTGTVCRDSDVYIQQISDALFQVLGISVEERSSQTAYFAVTQQNIALLPANNG